MDAQPTSSNLSELSRVNNAQVKLNVAHPFAPSGWNPYDAMADAAAKRYAEEQKVNTQFAGVLGVSPTALTGEKNIEFILARLRRVEQMIQGATISAACSTTNSTITVTLTWGAS